MSFIHRPRAVINGVRRTRTYRFFWCQNCDRTVRIASSLDPHRFLCPLCYSLLCREFHLSTSGLSMVQLQQEDNEPSSSPRLLDTMAQTIQPITCTFEESMPVIKITPAILERDSNCPICKEDFVVDENIRKMPCCHFYHSDCIIPWIQIHNTCPLCRFQIPLPHTTTADSNNNGHHHHIHTQAVNDEYDHLENIYDFRFEDVVNWAWPTWTELFSLWPFGFGSLFEDWPFQDHQDSFTATASASSRTASSWLGYLRIL